MKKKDSKIIIGSEPAKTRKRTERVVKRKASLGNEGVKRKIKKDVVHKTEQKKSLKGESRKASKALFSEASIKKSVEAALKEQIDEPLEGASKTPYAAPSTQSTVKKSAVEPLKPLTNESSVGVQEKMSVEPSIQSTSVVVPLNKQVNESSQVMKKRKTKVIKYEIDCSGINMDTTNFRKDLWDRVVNGKLNSAKNIRIKQTGNIIHLTSRSYVSKKCVRSNVHFLALSYMKQKKIDRAVHVVVMIVNAVPFLGFGFLVNFFMIIAGDYIEHTLGIYMCISTMAAADFGNTISDVLGLGLAHYVKRFCEFLGLRPPKLTQEQMELRASRRVASYGRALGIMVGCLLGMFPLWFINKKKPEDEAGKDSETPQLVNKL